MKLCNIIKMTLLQFGPNSILLKCGKIPPSIRDVKVYGKMLGRIELLTTIITRSSAIADKPRNDVL